MADDAHKGAFPTTEDLKDFLQSIWPKASDLSGAVTGISHNTVANWYRSPPREMSAPNLLQALIKTGKLDDFLLWLRAGARGPAKRPPLPGSASRSLAPRSNAGGGRKGDKSSRTG